MVVEILSINRAQDLEKKKDIYERHKIREYWVVDSAEHSIVKFTIKRDHFDDPEICYEQVKYDLLGFTIELKDIFP